MKTAAEISEALEVIIEDARKSGIELVYVVKTENGNAASSYTATPAFVCWAANELLYRMNRERTKRDEAEIQND